MNATKAATALILLVLLTGLSGARRPPASDWGVTCDDAYAQTMLTVEAACPGGHIVYAHTCDAYFVFAVETIWFDCVNQ